MAWRETHVSQGLSKSQSLADPRPPEGRLGLTPAKRLDDVLASHRSGLSWVRPVGT